MDHRWYILEGQTPIPVDQATWVAQFRDNVVKQDQVNGALVSTIFLGLNHNHGDGPPILFDTMICGGEHNDYQDRCSTWKQAEAMHEVACALARGNPSN